MFFQLLFGLFLFLCFSQGALADSFSVSDFELSPTAGPNDPGSPQECVIDGPGAVANDGRLFGPTDQLSIDRSCTVKNFTCDVPLESTLNFASHKDGTLIIFENVCYGGNFACANVEGSAFVWAVNGSDFSSVKEGCQDLIIPVEKIEKSAEDLNDNPISSVSVGVPFRYTLDVPVLFDPVSGTVIPGYGSLNDIGNIEITDDMTPGTMGVDLELLDISVSSDTTGAMTEGADYTVTSSAGNPSEPGVLTFNILNPALLPSGDQIHITIEVMLTDDPLNNIGKLFTNVAEWEFSREIDGTLYDPLPGQNGIAQLLSISRPDLQVDKTTTSSAVNFDDMPEYSIAVQNVGGAPAWNILVEDQIPVGMQDFDAASAVTVTMGGAVLDPADYDLNYNPGPGGDAGLLTVELLDSAGGLAANEILRIDYTSQLDQPGGSAPPTDGDVLTNVAAATTWYNDISTNTNRVEYTGPLTDGTVGTDDNQDATQITAALSGYYFEKTVSNVTSGMAPAFTAIPGDRLRYRVRLFNLDQEIYNVSITDQLDPARFDVASATVVSGCPAGATTCSFDGSGLLTVSGNIDVAPSSAQQSISIEFEVDLLDTLVDGDVASNQAEMSAEDDLANAVAASSDDPNVNGVVNQADPAAPPSDPTDIAIIAPGPLLKQNPAGLTETPIGEVFEYTLTVPQTPVNAPLYDIQVQDALPAALEPTTMLATATIIDGAGTPTGTTYNLTVTDTGSGLLLSENVTGLDLAANERARITLDVKVANILANQDSSAPYSNTATYTYSRINGGPQSDPAGTASTTAAMTIVEPDVTATKTVSNLDGNSPALGGDTLEYTVTLNNGGTSTAFDTSIVDTLPAGLELVAGSAEITLGGTTTQVDPDVTGSVLTWGNANGDDSLDIAVGESLVLTYQVVINSASNGDLINLADITWSSQDGAVDDERTGADAPDTTALDNYFVSVDSTLAYQDDTAFAKSVQADSWDDGGVLSTATDSMLRIGDTVTYELTVSLREGQTAAVTVADTLPTGLELVSFSYVNSANITFTPTVEPTAGARGLLSWDLGDVSNTPDADSSNDELVIELVAAVVAEDPDTLAQAASTLLTNSAELNYTGAAAPLPGQVDFTVKQPVMRDLTKVDTAGGRTGTGTNADPYQVDLAADTMQFQLETCNDGEAPAYNLAISDSLATQFDHTDLATSPVVQLGGAPLTAGTDYLYTAPAARGDAFTIVFNDAVPVDPGQCVLVDYSVGFNTDVSTTTAWSNNASLDSYWSLPATSGEQYTGSAAQVWMINASANPVPAKAVVGQADGEVVVGEDVVFTITVPADNIVRDNVTVTDALPPSLVLDDATVSIAGAAAVPAVNSGTSQTPEFNIGTLQAGEEALITLTTHVANTASANDGDTIVNEASYVYDGQATPLVSAPTPPLAIVEPLLSIGKAAFNQTNPGNPAAGGDVLEYSITMENTGSSTAFDTSVTDTLPAGVTLVANSASATIGGAPVAAFNATPTVNGNDLIWGAGNADESLDVPAGQTLVLTYQVTMTDVSQGTYDNLAVADWTSLDGSDPLQRFGDNCPTPSDQNDYCAGPATASVTSVDTSGFTKTVLADSWDDAYSTATDSTLRVGDTVTYALTLSLREGLTTDVNISDTLPGDMELVSFSYVNSGNITFTPTAEPAPGDSGTLNWALGDINNTPDGVANDDLVIEVEARVLAGGLTQVASTTLNNAATVNYDGGSSLSDNVDITVLQPVLSQVTKEDPAGNSYPNSGAALTVDIVNDTMSYVLETCNATDAAPAYNVQLVDTLEQELDETSISNLQVAVNGAAQSQGSGYNYSLTAGGGTADSTMAIDLLVPVEAGQCATVSYDVGFYTSVPPNQTWANRIQVSDYGSLPTPTPDGEQYSQPTPAEFWMTNAGTDPLPVKALISPSAQVTIGETVTYEITIPAIAAQRDNVVVTDTLEAALAYDSATATIGGAPATLNVATAGQDVTMTLGQIPAGETAVITLTANVVNTVDTNDGDTFRNEVSYTYDGLAAPLTSAPSDLLTIVEPLLTIGKTAANQTNPGSPAAGGDVLEYTVTMVNTGSSTAFDTTVTDTLPAGVTLVANSASATIGGAPVAAFNATPTVNGNDLIWGAGNADESLDVPAGQTLVLTYQVTMTDVSQGTYDNLAVADWTSLDGSDPLQRFGDNCPTPSDQNDYCAGPATASVTSVDTSGFTKTVLADSWDDAYSTAADSTLRVGDTVTYALTLSLREGLTTDVNISDTLPGDMELVSFSYVNSGNVTFTPTAEPAPGDSGTLNWALGDINNTPDGVANDDLVIEVEARVLAGGLTQVASTTLNNAATVNYDGGASLSDNVDITVLQPVLSQVTKEDPAGNSYPNSGAALTVDIVNDTMSYVLESCNAAGAAPAYNVQLVDTLEQELDETSISNLQVAVNGAAQTQGSGYNYSLTAGGGTADSTMAIDLRVPVEAGQCATVSYDVGFYTSVPPNSSWANNILVNRYQSLPAPATGGEQYTPLTPAQFWMTNAVVDPVPVKSVVLPVSPDAEVTIGESVSYEITVPAINAARSAVIVTDTLTDELVFDSATLSIGGAAATPVANSGAGQDLQFELGDIQAGDDAVVTVTAYVDNSAITNDSVTLDNSASYTYTGYAGAALDSAPAETLTIVEPLLGLTKDVVNLSNPGNPAAGGDVLEYTVTLANTGNATAFDTNVVDTLPTGLTLVASSATAEIGGVAVTGFNPDPTVNGSDLIWGAGNADESLDVPAGETLVMTYQATVGAASGTLANSVIADWTSLDTVNPLERIGDNCPAPTDFNDYCVGPVVSSIDTAADIDITKTVFNVSTGLVGDNASPGDVLEYTITIDNRNSVSLPDFSFLDDPGSWNSDVVFAPGSITALTVTGSSYNDASVINGGTNGAGLIDLRNLALGADGSGSDVVTVTFRITLAPVITSGTLVENQSSIEVGGAPVTPFDPATGIAQTLIQSAPLMQVEKVSDDITGDPAVLEPGDTLRYTLTVANLGDEDARDVLLRDAIPQYTTYVSGSTTLNGTVVADPAAGVSIIESGMQVNVPANPTPGAVDADPSAAADYTATITFDVVIDAGVLTGTRIVNQGFVNGAGAGGNAIPEQPSDDPATTVPDDPTVDIVGALPLLDAQKTVALTADAGTQNSPDPNDTLTYTFTVTNTASLPGTNVSLIDQIPPGTSYVLGSTTLNGAPVADISGASPLVSGMLVNSPGEAAGVVAGNGTATVTIDVTIDGTTAPGTVIINQGTMSSNELPDELTDEDGVDSNGDQPTEITVGEAQQLSIVKDVAVVGGGPVVAGSELEYTIQVANVGTVDATEVRIEDDLNWLTGFGNYVVDSARLNGSVVGITEGPILTADYSTAYGNLQPGSVATLRFRVLLDDTVPDGTLLSNTAVVYWNNDTQSASSTVEVQVGAIPGTATLNGSLWHDVNFDNIFDATEMPLENWDVQVWQNSTLLTTVQSGADGVYSLVGLPETMPGESYELRFMAPDASSSTALLGLADSGGAFTDGLQQITGITAAANSLVENLNLPIDPNGVVYNSMSRQPVSGASLTLLDSNGTALASSCFDDPAQQGQVTPASGFYKFDLTPGVASCQSASYVIEVTAPGGGFEGGVSQLILPVTDGDSGSYDVQTCADDAVAGTTECEAQPHVAPQPQSVPAESPLNGYYLHLAFSDMAMPDDSQIFNNHIPLDPVLDGVVSISKTAGVVNASRGDFVPYVIRIRNRYDSTLNGLAIVDSFPAGFKFVEDSARLDDQPVALSMEGRQLILRNLDLQPDAEVVLKMLFIVGSGVGEGEYINRVQVFQPLAARALNSNSREISGEASASVRVVPDPDFDCTDVIGKVFDDQNMNGYQDDGEGGLPNVRAVTAQGLIVTSDEYGRFHITCAVVPNEVRGSNFILKVDDRSLPTGYRLTTENPLVRRATRGKMVKFNFGAALHRVVRLDLADAVFEPGTTDMRLQWQSRVPLLMEQLDDAPSILRLAYMAEKESPALVKKRLKTMKKMITDKWAEAGSPYQLVIETEVFWRTGAPLKGGSK